MKEKLQLTIKEYKEWSWHPNPQISPYYKNIFEIVQSSAKFLKLEEIVKFIALHSMKISERQELVDRFPANGDDHMIIIGTTGIMTRRV